MKRPILNHTERGDDPFLGSGTELTAAELEGWSCLDMDSEPRCVDVTVRRGEHLTGRTATPDGDGRSFAEMAQVLHPALDRKGRTQ
jgi:DNA modification methylase